MKAKAVQEAFKSPGFHCVCFYVSRETCCLRPVRLRFFAGTVAICFGCSANTRSALGADRAEVTTGLRISAFCLCKTFGVSALQHISRQLGRYMCRIRDETLVPRRPGLNRSQSAGAVVKPSRVSRETIQLRRRLRWCHVSGRAGCRV